MTPSPAPASSPAPAEPRPAAPPPATEEPPVGALAADEVLPADAGGGVPVPVAVMAMRGSLSGGIGMAGITGSGSGAPGIGDAMDGTGRGTPHGALLARLRARTAGCYPRAAVRRRVEGVVRVSFCVGETGAPVELRLDRSSGSRLLDDAALDCVIRGAAPLPGEGACVEVPIDFHLRR